MPDWKQRAKVLIDLGRYGEAIAALIEALAEQPDDAFVYSQLAYCHTSRGDKELALAAAYKAVFLAPNQGHAHYSLALCQFRANQPVLAQVAIVSALHRNPTDTGTLVLAARIAVACANREAACHLLDSALELDPTEKEARNLKVEILLHQQRKEEAKTINEETLRLHPEDPYAVEVHAWMLKEAGQLREAEERYDEVLRLNPHSLSSKEVKVALLKERNKISKFLLSFQMNADKKAVFYLLFSVYSILLIGSYLFDGNVPFKLPCIFAAQCLLVVLVLSRFAGPLSDAFLDSSGLSQLGHGDILQGRCIAVLVISALIASPLIWVLPRDLKMIGAISFVTPLSVTFLLSGFFGCTSSSRFLTLRASAFALGLLALVGSVMICWPVLIVSLSDHGPNGLQVGPGWAIHHAGLVVWAVLPLLALTVGYLVTDLK